MKRSLIALVAAVSFAAAASASAAVQGGGNSTSTNGYVISNNTPGFINHANDNGAADSSQTIDIQVWLKLNNQSQLDNLVQQQRTPGSGSYHQWLSQSQFDANYSPSSQQVNQVSNYLSAHNLTVTSVADNNFYVDASGTIADIEKALHVQIDSYTFDGQTYYSNTSDPTVNDWSGANIAGITGLDNYGVQPTVAQQTGAGETGTSVPLASSPAGTFFEGQCFRGVQTQSFKSGSTKATYTGNRYGADITNTALGHLAPCGYNPNELQTAYGLKSLYAKGLDGSGQTIVIVDAFGSPTIQQDTQTFSQVYGLPPVDLTVYRAPGVWQNQSPVLGASGWTAETTLDVEWAHAMAPGAKIDLIVGPTDEASLDEAINYAVVHNLGNVISNSWSNFEGLGNPARFDRDNRILEQAAAKGIDVNFSSGDWGDNSPLFGFAAPSFPADSPYATGIGGTSLALNADNSIAWQSPWGTSLTKIASKTGAPTVPPLREGFVYGTGGGFSTLYAKPSWQTGVPGTMRGFPDVSMLADPYTGAEIIITENGQQTVAVYGGTSLACPMFSGVAAIASQKAGHGLGQVAPLLYGLNGSAFSDIQPVTSSTNVSGSVTSGGTTTNYSADYLVGPFGPTALGFTAPYTQAQTPYYSAFYNSPHSGSWFTMGFGLDTTLTAGPGWDDTTGLGTPNGASFVDALAGS